MIIVGPSGMDERPGELPEVRKMIVDLHTAPKLGDKQRKIPKLASITPAGNLSAVGNYDSGINLVQSPAGLNDNLIVGHYAGSDIDKVSRVFFDVDLMAKISGAGFSFDDSQGNSFSGSNGSGRIDSGETFAINNFMLGANTNSATLDGKFTNNSSGIYDFKIEDINPAGVIPIQINGTFRKQ